jgi:hypothetical protein
MKEIDRAERQSARREDMGAAHLVAGLTQDSGGLRPSIIDATAKRQSSAFRALLIGLQQVTEL